MIQSHKNEAIAIVAPDGQSSIPNYSHSNVAVGSDHVRHFATDHLVASLKGRALSSSFVTMLAQSVQFAFMLGSTMILARLLSPFDFGLIAMVTTVIGFLRIFNEAGLSTATVQREGITHAQVSNLFWTNVALGGTITLLLALSSRVLAWFYREPRLIDITLALCITFLLTSLAVQHLALLKRQMRFQAIAVIQISATGAGALVGVLMAWTKCGYWSLVGMQLATPLVMLVLTWSFSHWRPQLPKRDGATRSMLHFGAHLTASSFLWSLARGSDSLLIGRVYGPAPLGLYSRAAVLLMRPIEQAIPTLGAVLVPTLSRLQTKPERYRRAVLQIYDIIAVSTFLSAGLLFALARPLTLLVLGQKWANAAPIFAGFTLVALYYPIGDIASWLLTSQGRGKDFLVLGLITSFLAPVFFIAGLPFGPVGVAITYSVFCLLVALPAAYYVAGRRGPVSTRDLWSRFFTQVPLWMVVCGVTLLMRMILEDAAPWKEVLVCAPAGLLAGIAFISIYPPARRAVLSLLRALKERREQASAE
jgi:O-antigen/teichoic acid export membrane protein